MAVVPSTHGAGGDTGATASELMTGMGSSQSGQIRYGAPEKLATSIARGSTGQWQWGQMMRRCMGRSLNTVIINSILEIARMLVFHVAGYENNLATAACAINLH
jgi:hypothetical protein